MMDLDREKRLNQILIELLVVPPGERQSSLSEACGGDQELADELAAILVHEHQLTGFLDQPPVLLGDGPTDDQESNRNPAPPERIGSYRILEALGKGGMGEVFLAEQTDPVRRRVALKVVSGTGAGITALYRFQAESQALARMSHLNIAQVFDAGLDEDGRAFIAMEYVGGTSITDYCDENSLSLGERLVLFAGVCDGIRHAHEKGILHRDIKPGNILVAEEHGRPIAKIIDFGIAKGLDEPLTDTPPHTGANRIVGTPGFLSPEALRGDEVDTRSDVYSLGLVLHRLLVGAPPCNGGSDGGAKPPSEILEGRQDLVLIASQRRTRPRTLVRDIRGELDWIILKAIAGDRESRYGSAADLAADLRRYQCHQPVEAAADSVAYRLRKLIRRHRVGAGATAVVVLALVFALVSSTLSARRAREEAVRAGREAESARQVTGFMIDLFENADPTRARGEDLRVAEVLDRGAERIGSELAGQPLIQATTMSAIGKVYLSLGLPSRAEPLLAEALKVRERELGQDHLDTATSCEDLAVAYFSQARYEEAEQLCRRALALHEAQPDPEQAGVARALGRLAISLWAQGETSQAEQLLRRAWSIHEQNPDRRDPDRAKLLNNYAIVLDELGRYDEAAARYRQALKILQRDLGRDHPWVAATMSNLAKVLKAQGRIEEAEPVCRGALAIREKVLGPDHTDVAASLNMLANLHIAREHHAAAEPLLERALAIREKALGPEHVDVAESITSLASVYQAGGHFERAYALRERALAIWQQGLGADHPYVATGLLNLGTAAMDLGRLDAAEELLQHALHLFEETSGPEHPDIGYVMLALGSLRRLQGRDEEAVSCFHRAITLREALSADDPVLGKARAALQ